MELLLHNPHKVKPISKKPESCWRLSCVLHKRRRFLSASDLVDHEGSSGEQRPRFPILRSQYAAQLVSEPGFVLVICFTTFRCVVTDWMTDYRYSGGGWPNTFIPVFQRTLSIFLLFLSGMKTEDDLHFISDLK